MGLSWKMSFKFWEKHSYRLLQIGRQGLRAQYCIGTDRFLPHRDPKQKQFPPNITDT